MKILMIPTFFGGISWWRFEIPAKALKEAGYDVTCVDSKLANKIGNTAEGFRKWLDEEMPKHDIVHIGYNGSVDISKTLLEARDIHNKPVIVDLDDDLDSVPPYNWGWKDYRPGSRGHRVAKILMTNADGLTFSTKPLQEAVGYLNQHSAVLGNWVDIDTFDYPEQSKRSEDQSVRLMITGGRARYEDWQIIKGVLEDAMAKYNGTNGNPMLRLFFIGATPDWVAQWMQDKKDPTANRCFYLQPGFNVYLFNQQMRYVKPDILVSPVITNSFNRSKSGLKFLEATLAGAAFLCTDYPTYDVAPKGTCLKVDNTETQWRESLSALIEDATLRAQLVDKARDHVLAHCTAEAHINDRVNFYSEVIARRANLGNLDKGALQQSNEKVPT